MLKEAVQQGRPLCPSFVKRRSSFVDRSAEARLRDTLHEERFTDDGNAAGGLFSILLERSFTLEILAEPIHEICSERAAFRFFRVGIGKVPANFL